MVRSLLYMFALKLTSLIRLTGGVILKIVYGYTIDDENDPFVENADIAIDNFSKSTSPGWLVDVVPARARLNHTPAFAPLTFTVQFSTCLDGFRALASSGRLTNG